MATPQVPAEASKLQPKLRMLANGSTAVNARRAEHAAAVKVSPKVAKRFAPARARFWIANADAAWPDARANAATPPSRAAILFSSTSLVGFMMRE